MKTVGYVLSTFPVLSETFIGNEMRAMSARGHQIVPIAMFEPIERFQPDDHQLASIARYTSGISRVRALKLLATTPIGTLRALAFALKQKGMSAKSLLLLGAKVAVVAKAQHCMHLHAHFALHTAAAAIIAGRLLSIPVSFVGHGFDIYARPADLPLKLECASFAVAVCQDMADRFRSLQPAARVALIHCGVDVTRFPLVQPVWPSQATLLFVGRLTEKKGLSDLLNALAMLDQDIRPILHLVGSGPQQPLLENLIQRLGLSQHVSFLGSKDAQWIVDNACHYWGLVAPFCESADGDRDTGPLVLKEAMALGLPVITTDFMGCREIVSADSGLTVPPKDIDSLARAIQSFVFAPEAERLAMRRKGRERVLQWFTSERQAQLLSSMVEVA